VGLLVGNGNGTLQAAQTFYAGATAADVASADFNADARLDVAVANDVSLGTMTVLLGAAGAAPVGGQGGRQAMGTAAPAVQSSTGSSLNSPVCVRRIASLTAVV
jgi:hypothetical protein